MPRTVKQFPLVIAVAMVLLLPTLMVGREQSGPETRDAATVTSTQNADSGSSQSARDLSALRAEAYAAQNRRPTPAQKQQILRTHNEILNHPDNHGEKLVDDLGIAVEFLLNDERYDEVIRLMLASVTARPAEWRLKLAVAGSPTFTPKKHELYWESTGYKVGQQLHRGYPDDEGQEEFEFLSFEDHDLIQKIRMTLDAIHLMADGSAAAPDSSGSEVPTSEQKSDAFEHLADLLFEWVSSGPHRMDELTDLSRLPDPSSYDDYLPGRYRTYTPKVQDESGLRARLSLPSSWDTAGTNRERWHWALEQAALSDPSRRSRLELNWIEHLDELLGISLAFPPRADDDPDNSQPASNDSTPRISRRVIRELSDSETYIRTVTGVKRITLDDEINPLVLLNRIIAREDDSQIFAMNALVMWRIHRHQLAEAAAELEQILVVLDQRAEALPPTAQEADSADRVRLNSERVNCRYALDQIRGQRVSIDDISSLRPSGMDDRPDDRLSADVRVTLKFRNAASTTMRLIPLSLNGLIERHVAAEFTGNSSSSPSDANKDRRSILTALMKNKGRLLTLFPRAFEEEQMLIGEANEWIQALTPQPDHELTTETVNVHIPDTSVPWLLTTGDGETADDCRLLWEPPAALAFEGIRESAVLGFLADTRTGEGISGAQIDVTVFDSMIRKESNAYPQVALQTDENGMFELPRDLVHDGFLVCRKDQKILAVRHLSPDSGRQRATTAAADLQTLLAKRPRAFVVTDRVIYRPGDTLQFQVWVRKPFGELNLIPDSAESWVMITHDSGDSDGPELHVVSGIHDAAKGFRGEWKIPIDARPGDYELQPGIRNADVGQRTAFRIEEYRKPEFTVKLSPLARDTGTDQQRIHVEATYLFGKPVSSGSVRWNLAAQSEKTRQYPVERWDSLYRNGYAWRRASEPFAASHRHSGLLHFGPLHEDAGPGGLGFFSVPADEESHPHPESESTARNDEPLLMKGMMPLRSDGTCEIILNGLDVLLNDGINTIEVEVIDATHRIVTESLFLGSHSEVQVCVRTDRSFCARNDTIQVTVGTLDHNGRPLSRPCLIDVLDQVDSSGQLSFEDSSLTLNVTTDENGIATVPVTLSRTGRVGIRVRAAENADADHRGLSGKSSEESDWTDVFVLDSDAPFDIPVREADFRVERAENADGSTARLLITGPTPNATALVFLRPVSGESPPPIIVKLAGNAAVIPVTVGRDDIPSISAKAVWIADGRFRNLSCRILVPPVAQRLEIHMDTGAAALKPGDVAEITLQVNDSSGIPAAANLLLAAYDESLDQLAVPDAADIIHAFYSLPDRQWSATRFPYVDYGIHFSQHAPVSEDSGLISVLSAYAGVYRLGFDGAAFGGGSFGGLGGGGFGGGGFGGGGFGGGGVFGGIAAPDAAATIATSTNLTLPFVDPRLRHNWQDTAFFSTDLETDAEGQVTVSVPLPDNLTTWKFRVWAIDRDVRVGYSETSVATSRSLMIRPHVPRHLTYGDRISISAAVYSSFDTEKRCRVSLQSDSETMRVHHATVQDVLLAPDSETVVHWTVETLGVGDAEFRFSAQTDEDADAAQLAIPIHPRGEWQNSMHFASVSESDPDAILSFEIDADRLPEKSFLELRWATTVADAVLDALPFLVEYPHGCAEQTTNRFVPLALAHSASQEFPRLQLPGASGERAEQDTIAVMADPPRAMGKRRLPNEATFRRMLFAGRQRLQELQEADGGWSWFGSAGVSSPELTAQVVYGLFLAMDDESRFSHSHRRGIRYLSSCLSSRIPLITSPGQRDDATGRPPAQRSNDSDALVAFVLTQIAQSADFDEPADLTDDIVSVLQALDRDADQLTSLGTMLAALAAHALREHDLQDRFLERAEQRTIRDDVTQTIRMSSPAVRRGGWFESSGEALGRYLQLRLRINPEDPELDWISRGLLRNRRSTLSWENTRDTAVAIEALIELLKSRKYSGGQPQFEVLLNGEPVQRISEPADGEAAVTRIRFDSASLSPGRHTVAIRRLAGPGFDAILVSREFSVNPVAVENPADRPLRITRRFYKVDSTGPPSSGNGTDVRNHSVRQHEITEEAGMLQSGDVIEVELEIVSRDDYEYLMVQNPHPAGFELYNTLPAIRGSAGQEMRDDRLDMYFSSMSAGTHVIRYQLRAEHAGELFSNPARVTSMYYDEISAVSDAFRFRTGQQLTRDQQD